MKQPSPSSPSSPAGAPAATASDDDRYKWIALSNTTMAVFMSGPDSSIVIISLPAIFRGIHLDPLAPSVLPSSLYDGLHRHGVPASVAHHVASLPPVSSLFSALLGTNPVGHLLGSGGVLQHLLAADRQALTGREFFPRLIAAPFITGWSSSAWSRRGCR